MEPVCFKLGGLTVHWYGVMMALGFLAGLANWVWLGRREHRSFNTCSDLLFWIMVSGVIGARVAYVAANWEEFSTRLLSALYVWEGGLIYYGGFVGACLAVAFFARWRGEFVLDTWDFAVTALPLGHAFGRVGCFLNGCCHGIVTHALCAVQYPAGTLPWWRHVDEGALARTAERSLPVHPVQLYEAGFDLLVYASLIVLFRRRKRSGSTAATYLVLYPVGRFMLEFLRGDPRLRFGGLSLAQWISVGLAAAGILLAVLVRILSHRSDRLASSSAART